MPASKNNPSFGNLPMPLSTFIGRESEIAEVQRLLSEHRLVTLTGPDGCGKTCLAIKVAQPSFTACEHIVRFNLPANGAANHS